MRFSATRSDWSGAARLTLALVALGGDPAAAEPAGPRVAQAAPDALRQRDRELETLRAEQQRMLENERKLKLEIDAIGDDRRKLNQTLIDSANRVRTAEENIAATERRLQPLETQETGIRGSLEARRGVIAEILASLQRLGHRPPPALMVRPEDALQSLRTAMMLGAVIPEMRDKAKALADDLAELARVKAGIEAEKAKYAQDLQALTDERQRITALVEERRNRQAAIEKTLESEKQRAAALAQQTGNLRDLIVRLEQNLDSASRAARAAARAAEEQKLKGESKPNLAALKDPGRLTPAITFASARGTLPIPAYGIKIRDFGAPDGVGSTEKGISIATRAAAQVTSPCDGWVVYSAPYRNYGQLLILNAGGGYHILLAGMDRISVDLGQFVLTGEPVAVMGNGTQITTNVSAGSSQPVLYVEFRKDGTPVDPSPWWATSEGEKVRG